MQSSQNFKAGTHAMKWESQSSQDNSGLIIDINGTIITLDINKGMQQNNANRWYVATINNDNTKAIVKIQFANSHAKDSVRTYYQDNKPNNIVQAKPDNNALNWQDTVKEINKIQNRIDNYHQNLKTINDEEQQKSIQKLIDSDEQQKTVLKDSIKEYIYERPGSDNQNTTQHRPNVQRQQQKYQPQDKRPKDQHNKQSKGTKKDNITKIRKQPNQQQPPDTTQ